MSNSSSSEFIVRTIEQAIVHLLRTVPETWEDYDPSTLSELQEQAVYLLVAASMIERRITLRLRMAGHPVAVEATFTVTGEVGLSQALDFVVADIWKDWREAFEQCGGRPASYCCERIGNEQWRLTAIGVVARNDLAAGNEATVLDFVLRRGLFDGQPHRLPDGRIIQRPPVAGRGILERMRRVGGDAGPTGVAITNWEAGAQAFAAAFAEIPKAKQATEAAGNKAEEPADPAPAVVTNRARKRSTERGEGRAKLIAALTKHHQYADGSCLNLEPVGCNELAKAAGVSPSTASAFFHDEFRGHKNYQALCRDVGKLAAALKLLNDEFAPYHLLGAASSDLAAPEQDDADSD
jgi:hypothetical protein